MPRVGKSSDAAATLLLLGVSVWGLWPPPSSQVAQMQETVSEFRTIAHGWIRPKRVAEPTTLQIPKIEVSAQVERIGLTLAKKMEAPTGWMNVGWYTLGPRPGERGTAVIAGHLDSYTGTAVFWDLRKLVPGDEIFMTDEENVRRRFVVRGTAEYRTHRAPIAEIFKDTGEHRIVLITCEGKWQGSNGYDRRLVIFAEAEN